MLKRNLYISTASAMPAFMTAGVSEKFEYCTLTVCDMTDYGWVKVGEAEITCTFTETAEAKAAALKATNEAIVKLETEMLTKLAALKAFRSELLCLEAPSKESDDVDCF